MHTLRCMHGQGNGSSKLPKARLIFQVAMSSLIRHAKSAARWIVQRRCSWLIRVKNNVHIFSFFSPMSIFIFMFIFNVYTDGAWIDWFVLCHSNWFWFSTLSHFVSEYSWSVDEDKEVYKNISTILRRATPESSQSLHKNVCTSTSKCSKLALARLHTNSCARRKRGTYISPPVGENARSHSLVDTSLGHKIPECLA